MYREIRAVEGAGAANQSSGNRQARGGALAGNAGIGDASGGIDRDHRQVNAVHRGRGSEYAGQGSVVSELDFVEYARRERAVQSQHGILRQARYLERLPVMPSG